MVEIPTSLYKYVPQVEYLEEYHIPEIDDIISLEMNCKQLHYMTNTSYTTSTIEMTNNNNESRMGRHRSYNVNIFRITKHCKPHLQIHI